MNLTIQHIKNDSQDNQVGHQVKTMTKRKTVKGRERERQKKKQNNKFIWNWKIDVKLRDQGSI